MLQPMTCTHIMLIGGNRAAPGRNRSWPAWRSQAYLTCRRREILLIGHSKTLHSAKRDSDSPGRAIIGQLRPEHIEASSHVRTPFLLEAHGMGSHEIGRASC